MWKLDARIFGSFEWSSTVSRCLEANSRSSNMGTRNAPQFRQYVSLFVLIVFLAFVFAGVRKHSLTNEPSYDTVRERNEHPGFFAEHGLTRLNISVEHYPSPGECRIWFLDLPANVQSPSGNCKHLLSVIPAGAWLIRRSKNPVNHASVTVYDTKKPGEVAVAIGVFNIDTDNLIYEVR
jgi:hypothetical protein